MKLRMVIAYDGRPFHGWQSQRGGGSIQDVLEAQIGAIAGKKISLHGSGRTDAGVHALGQCAHFETESSLTPADWLRALNARLPSAIRVMQCRRAAPDFHARFSATGKCYRYVIFHGPVLPPLEVGRAWHVYTPLDADRLDEGCRLFTGRHDFSAFAANRGTVVRTAVRTIHEIRLRRRGPLWSLTFEGDGFLYKMVRMLVGALVRLAQSRESLDDLRQRLATGSPKWNHVAPAEGLYLDRVYFTARATGGPSRPAA